MHPINTINQILQQIQQSQDFTEFDNVKLPFEHVQASLNLCKSIFTPEVLQIIANSDTDTLEAWAIALSKTVNTQLELLNYWLPDIINFPISEKLKQKINDNRQAIVNINSENSKLLSTASELLDQESYLFRQANELKFLKQKVEQLEQLKEELQSTNLETLRQEIAAQTEELEPQQKLLQSLQQQKTDLDEKIGALQSQQATLKEEISYWQTRLNRLEITTTDTIKEALTLTQQQREHLSQALSTELAQLEKQRNELAEQSQSYRQVQQQLHQAKEDFQKYQAETTEILSVINSHYHSNVELGTLLPVDCKKIDILIKNTQETLKQIDQELATARKQHEQAQQKNHIPL